MNRRNRHNLDGQKIFSIVASLAIVAVLAVGVVFIVKSSSSGEKKNFIDLNLAEGQTGTAGDNGNQGRVADNREQQTNLRPQEQASKAAKETKPETEAATEAATDAVWAADIVEETAAEVNAPVYKFDQSSSLLWPVEGDILLAYNMDNTIYFPTLDQYKCNPAIVIGAGTGTEVLSAAPGVVEDIYEDAVTGTTMIVSIGDGYRLKYGQLGNLQVGISQAVEAGTVLGTVSEPTKYFSVEGSNLYFAMTHDSEPVDPTLYLID